MCAFECVCVLVQSDSTLGLRFPRKAQLSQFSARLIAALIVFVDSDKESRYHLSVPPIYHELPFIFLFAALHRCYVNTFWVVVVVVGGLPVLMEFVVAVWSLLSFSSTGACFWNKKSIAVF